MSLSNGATVEGYVIEELVSETGMVTVYKARHSNLGTTHALKLLQPKYAEVPEIRKGFIAEMRMFSAIEHPNLVSISEIVQTRKYVGIAMDWLDGENLKTHLRRMGKVDIETGLAWTGEILTALQQLHQHRMYHLEICPANIFLAYGPQGSFYAVLMDYGVGHRFLPGNVSPSFSPHARYYISPELITNPRTAGARSDIYSVGVSLYEMLAGECPFIGETVFATSNSIVSGSWEPIHEVANYVPKSISHVISQSMQKNPVARYPTAQAFMHSLSRAVGRSLSPDDQEKRMIDDLEGMVQDLIDEVDEDIGHDTADDRGGPVDVEIMDEPPAGHVDVESDGENESGYAGVGQPGGVNPRRSRLRAIDKRKPKEHVKEKFSFNTFRQQFGVLHIVLVILVGFWVYWSFLRGRNVFIIPRKLPPWGKKIIKVDGEITTERAFPMMSLGEHIIELSGGVYDGSTCTRCCWKKEIPFTVPIGMGEFIFAVKPSDQDGTLPRCPTELSNMAFSFIPPGKFYMGTPLGTPGRQRDEYRHQVEITRPLLISQTEITQLSYSIVMGENPSQQKESESHPVETVSWLDAIRFSNKLSELEGLDLCYKVEGEMVSWENRICKGYRLLTEAEWEYAAKADKLKPYAGSDKVKEVAWIATNSQGESQPVGQKRANSWLLYDMSGNVHEWVWDIYGTYQPAIYQDPGGPQTGVYRVLRGGDWYHVARRARVANRDKGSPRFRASYIGFRVARLAE